MRYPEQIVKMTQKAIDDLCRSAAAIPDGHHTWSPGGEARSVLDQMQEIATQASWFLPILRDGRVPEFNDATRIEAARIRASFDSVPKCIEEAKRSTTLLCQSILAFPTDRHDDEITLPFGGEMVATMADVLALPYWNIVYHFGQINQIQLMLGDLKMH